jgi:16S rRNA (cytosine1402-N4)-methyltransferase
MDSHITVLRTESIAALAIKPTDCVIDATMGSGGHASLIVEKLGPQGQYVGIDADPTAITGIKSKLAGALPRVTLVTDNFRNLNSILDTLQITSVNAILADLGWRQEQFSHGGRGFSFKVDEPLYMTYGDPLEADRTAAHIVNSTDETELARLIFTYGEERYSRRIARAICEARRRRPLVSSGELAHLIEEAVPAAYRHGRIHPATRTFQALRIAVNDEFGALEEFIPAALSRLAPGGRLAIISFHSLEDRIVKHLFRTYAHDGYGEVATKKPISPTAEEIAQNPRARSAKLRLFIRYENQNTPPDYPV